MIRLTRRDFGTGMVATGALATTAIATDILANHAFAANTAAPMTQAAATSPNVSWTSADPHLSGNFLPVAREIEAADLEVVQGKIPDDLSGAYMRNGPNPLFKPIAFAYPMDGDGMIHAVYFDNGRARYKNRFVQTAGLTAEKRAGRAIYGSFTHPVAVDPALLQPGDPKGPFKNGAFINVLQHGGKLLALNEATNCYEMTMELDTVGLWKAGTDQPIRLGAHNRRHPKTGSLFTLAYSSLSPDVLFHEIDAAGKVVKTFSLTMAMPTMIHDFVLTERHIVLLAGPAVFDIEAVKQGKPFMQWRPELGTRIALMALDGSDLQWLDTNPFFVFHFANAFEQKGKIVIDYVKHESLVLGYAAAMQKPPTLYRMAIDIAGRKTDEVQVADRLTEFPRVNDRLDALPTRFVYLPTLSKNLLQDDPASATFNVMMKADTETGQVRQHDFGNRIAGEATFIPRGDGGEDDGYLAIFAFDPAKEVSDLVLLDAADIEADPVATIRMPQRVPQGLHGNWIAKG